MQKKTFFTLSLSLLLMLGLAACQQPLYSEAPEYGNLKFTKDSLYKITLDNQVGIKTSSICNPGDSITVFMQVAYSGAYITEADYAWKLYLGDSIIANSDKVIAPHKQKTPPMWRFKAPETKGSYVVTFEAKYDYSAQTIAGQIYGKSSSYRADLNVR